jgi:DNA-binding GntR family transcriptional regulator
MRFDKIRAIIDSARANLDRARRLILSPRRLALTIAEHQTIVDAIARGDATAASDAMRAHLDGVKVELLAFAADNRGLFADGAQLETVAK